MENGILDEMVDEAVNQVSKKGWGASQKAVILAAFGLMSLKIEQKVDKVIRPAWVIATSIGMAALWWIISGMFGLN